jgi:hypothetical protein
MTKQIWVVTFHFGRGHSQTNWFEDKKQAQEALRVAVFNNEDCINCTVHRQDVEVPDSIVKLNKLFELRDRILNKM